LNGQDALAVDRCNPREFAGFAGFPDGLRIEGRIAQHDHLGPFGHRQLADQLGRYFGLLAERPLLLLAIIFGIEGLEKGNACAAGVISNPITKPMATLAGILVLAVTTTFARPPLVVAGAVGVLGLFVPLAVQCLVQKKQPSGRLWFRRLNAAACNVCNGRYSPQNLRPSSGKPEPDGRDRFESHRPLCTADMRATCSHERGHQADDHSLGVLLQSPGTPKTA